MNLIPGRLPGLVLVLLAAGAHGQDEKVNFDPARDLPGHEAVRASPDKDLYPLESFDALLGDEMDIVALTFIEITGRLDAASLDEAHKAWIENRPTEGF